MKKIYCLFCFSLCFITCFSQKSPIKFGDVSMEELRMTSYDHDSSASAVILSDYGEAYILFSGTVQMNFERHIRIKILKKDGMGWADASIPLYHSGTSEERVSGLKASSYNLVDGKVVETKMTKDGIFKEKFNKHINLQKFTIPNVTEGTVLEYSYKLVSDFPLNFPNWQFQYSIPVKRSEYWAILPDFLIFEKYMQGYLTLSDYEVKHKAMATYQAQGHHWILNHAPAFREEPFMTSESDYISKMNFAISHINIPGTPTQELMGSWAKLNNDLLESEAFGKAITGSNFLKKTVEEITAGMTEPMEKLIAIHNYVKQNIEWDGTKDILADPVKKILELKKGTAGDINITLASMLEKAGIVTEMVLLSTRDHGFIRKSYPMQKQFNYVVCEATIDGKPVYLDATERYLPVNVLPERCLNGEGYRVSAVRQGWIAVKANAKSKTVVSADLSLDESGGVSGALEFTRDGYDAARMRREFYSKGQESYLKDLFSTRNWQITGSEFANVAEVGQAAKEKHQLAIQDHATVAGDVIYVNPFITSQIVSNPFKQASRVYPIDFGSPVEKIYMCRIAIPEGFQVDEIPQSKVFMLPGNAARFMFNVSQSDQAIQITSNFQINKNLFLQDDYLNLKEFYSQVVAKQSEQIVLKKKLN